MDQNAFDHYSTTKQLQMNTNNKNTSAKSNTVYTFSEIDQFKKIKNGYSRFEFHQA